MDDGVFALAFDAAGNLYAGGWFQQAGGVSAPWIAKWNGTAWSALGTGMNEGVNALATDANNILYAGGNFTTAGGVSANRIARWNGSSWSALGTGMNDEVTALVVDASGNLYAGGSFTTAGGVAANRIARWNGSTWSALGSGLDGQVSSLAINSSGQLIAAGNFSTPGNGIALWNGSGWVDLNPNGQQAAYYSGIATRAGKVFLSAAGALFELRPSIATATQSAAAADPVTGNVHLAVVNENSVASYLRWSDNTQTWGTPVTLDSATATSRVATVFDQTSGNGAALWRDTDGNIYKKDFSENGSVAASADLVATGWFGDFMASESGNGNLFTLFGRNANWLLQRLGFSTDGP